MTIYSLRVHSGMLQTMNSCLIVCTKRTNTIRCTSLSVVWPTFIYKHFGGTQITRLPDIVEAATSDIDRQGAMEFVHTQTQTKVDSTQLDLVALFA